MRSERPRINLRGVVTVCGLSCFCPVAKAQAGANSDSQANVDAAQSDAAQTQESSVTLTVQGERRPRSATEVIVGKRELRAAPHKSASEMLLVVPGAFVSQHSGEGKAHQVFFRGFDAVHGQDIEFWAAGAPVNDVSNVHGQGYADLHFLIPEIVKSIHSSPGNYDPRQGDFAVAGTMRYTLGYDEPGLTLKTSVGSFGARRYFVAYHPKHADDKTFGAFEFASTDGFGPSRSARRGSAIAQATYDLTSDVKARAMVSTYAGRFDSAGVLRLSDIETDRSDRFETYDPKQGGHSTRTQLVLSLDSEHRDRDGLPEEGFTLSPFAVLRTLELRSNFTGFQQNPEGDSLQQVNDALTLGATASTWKALKLFSPHDRIEVGLFLRADSIRQSQHRLSTLNDRVTDDASHPGVSARISALNAAGYVDVSLKPMRRVTLKGGLRMDSLSYAAEDEGGSAQGQVRHSLGAQLSKRGTLDVVLLPGLNALASYGEGFRSPQARSLANAETTPFTRVTSFETGFRFRDSERLQASAALYRTLLSDDLVFDQARARNERVPGTSRTGVSLQLKAAPNTWFISNTSFTYAHAEFRESDAQYQQGELLPYVPQYVARSDLAFTPRLGRAFGSELTSHIGWGLTYLGRRPLPFSEFGHDAFLVDARAGVRIGAVQVELEIFNVLDAAWYDGEFVYASKFNGSDSLVPIRHVSVGPPRIFMLSLSLFV